MLWTHMPVRSKMETQEESLQFKLCWLRVRSHESRHNLRGVIDSSMYHMEPCLRGKYFGRLIHISLLGNTDARNHLTRQLDKLCFIEEFQASNQILQCPDNVGSLTEQGLSAREIRLMGLRIWLPLSSNTSRRARPLTSVA